MKSLLLLATLLAATLSMAMKLPKGFHGHWQGIPTTTVIGPFNHTTFNFSIMPLEKHDGGDKGWLMSDQFEIGSGKIPRSQQQFWVISHGDESTLNGTLTYCGALRGFLNVGPPQTVDNFQFHLTNQTSNSLEWQVKAKHHEGHGHYSGRWKLALVNATTLHSQVWIGDPAMHFDCVYTRFSGKGVAPWYHGISHRLLSAAKTTYLGDGHSQFAPPCNLTDADEVGPVTLAKQQQEGRRARSRCPHGFTAEDGPMPEFVKRALEGKNNKKETETTATTTAAPTPKTVHKCYKLNHALDVTVRYAWHYSNETLDIEFSALVPNGGDVMSHYIAIGFVPNWPGMDGMDVTLGYFSQSNTTSGATACVRSMYAKYYVGPPVDGPDVTQIINNTGLSSTNDGRLVMRFSRTWQTGHHDLNSKYVQSMPTVAFALGKAPQDNGRCDGEPHYHYNNRGVLGMLWAPEYDYIVPEHLVC